jgi:hypothetical protein
MGASLTMIDRHYGHLAKDGRHHAINLLDTFTEIPDVHAVDARWTRKKGSPAALTPETTGEQDKRQTDRALCRTRTDDPFLTMEVLYQLS